MLLEADPSRDQIEKYLHSSLVIGLEIDSCIVGVVVLWPKSKSIAEVMNIAVDKSFRGKGLGKKLRGFGPGQLFTSPLNSSV